MILTSIPEIRVEGGPFHIPMTKTQFERELQAFVERAFQPDVEGVEPYRMPSILSWRILRRRRTEKERRMTPRWTGETQEWETITNIAEADVIVLTLSPFEGLVLEIEEWPKVSVYPEGNTQSVTVRENGVWRHKGCKTEPVDPRAHAALSGWLRSLEPPKPMAVQDARIGKPVEFELPLNGTLARFRQQMRLFGKRLIEEYKKKHGLPDDYIWDIPIPYDWRPPTEYRFDISLTDLEKEEPCGHVTVIWFPNGQAELQGWYYNNAYARETWEVLYKELAEHGFVAKTPEPTPTQNAESSTGEIDYTKLRRIPNDFADLEIHILQRRDEGYPVQITLGGEQVSPQNYLSADILSWVPGVDSVSDGQRLFDALFADGVLRDAWMKAHGQSAQRRIRLRIDPNAPELHILPWELLRDGDTMLSADGRTPFSRYLPIFESWGGAVEERPIRVLAVISNPADLEDYNLAPLDVEAEQGILRVAFSELDEDEVELTFLTPPVTLERLETKLHEGYHILHYLGHGAFSKKKQSAALYMQDEAENAQTVRDEQFSSMLSRQRVRPRLVFLAACQSAARSTMDAFLGLGPKLVTAGVLAVVAMQDQVAITTARKLSQVFYQRLAEHGVVDCAMNEARSVLLTAGRPDAAVPVLFMRLKSGQLWRDVTEEESGVVESEDTQPERAPASDQFTTTIGSVTGPVHTGSGDIIYSASSQEEKRSDSQIPQLTLKLFQMGRDRTHRDEIIFRQRGGPIYGFGLALENTSLSLPVKGIRIDVYFWWEGGDTLQTSPQFQVPLHAKGWTNKAVGLIDERPAHLSFRGPDFVCFPEHSEKWGSFMLTLAKRVNVSFRVTYKISSVEPYTQNSGKLKITFVQPDR